MTIYGYQAYCPRDSTTRAHVVKPTLKSLSGDEPVREQGVAPLLT